MLDSSGVIQAQEAKGASFFIKGSGPAAKKKCELNDTCVLGVKRLGRWKFYYQQSAYMHYTKPDLSLGLASDGVSPMHRYKPEKLKTFCFELPEAG